MPARSLKPFDRSGDRSVVPAMSPRGSNRGALGRPNCPITNPRLLVNQARSRLLRRKSDRSHDQRVPIHGTALLAGGSRRNRCKKARFINNGSNHRSNRCQIPTQKTKRRHSSPRCSSSLRKPMRSDSRYRRYTSTLRSQRCVGLAAQLKYRPKADSTASRVDAFARSDLL